VPVSGGFASIVARKLKTIAAYAFLLAKFISVKVLLVIPMKTINPKT